MDTFMTILIFSFVVLVVGFFVFELVALIRDIRKRKKNAAKKEGAENGSFNENEKD